jgi:hypothetical protein
MKWKEFNRDKPLSLYELEEGNMNEEFLAFVLLSLFCKNQVRLKRFY